MCRQSTIKQLIAYYIVNMFLVDHLQYIAKTHYRSAIKHYNAGNFKRYHQLIKIITNTGRKNGFNLEIRVVPYRKNNCQWLQIHVGSTMFDIQELNSL